MEHLIIPHDLAGLAQLLFLLFLGWATNHLPALGRKCMDRVLNRRQFRADAASVEASKAKLDAENQSLQIANALAGSRAIGVMMDIVQENTRKFELNLEQMDRRITEISTQRDYWEQQFRVLETASKITREQLDKRIRIGSGNPEPLQLKGQEEESG